MLSTSEDVSLFDQLSIGDGQYMQMGEDGPLQILLQRAAQTLQTLDE